MVRPSNPVMSFANVLLYTCYALTEPYIPRPTRASGHTILNLCFSLNIIIKESSPAWRAVLKSLTAAESRPAWTQCRPHGPGVGWSEYMG